MEGIIVGNLLEEALLVVKLFIRTLEFGRMLYYKFLSKQTFFRSVPLRHFVHWMPSAVNWNWPITEHSAPQVMSSHT